MAIYNIIYRSHDATEHYSRYPRPFGLDKPALIRACFSSLIASLDGHRFRIQIIGDRLSDETVEFYSRSPVSIVNEEFGPALAFARAVDLALAAEDDEWVYLCEDDYLHHADCFRNIDDLIENRHEYLAYEPKPRWRRLRANHLERKPLYLYPADYPDRYEPKRRRASFIFHSRYCHWRQITSTTFSFMGEGRELRRHTRLLRACAEHLDDRTLSRSLYGDISFWGKGLCLSPIPGLSSHMHEGKMSVLGDWERLYHKYRTDLKPS